jgi:hypothetical protein
MTANVSLDQFVYLKQPACDYLSQGYQISYHLTDLKEAIEQLLFSINAFLKSGHKMIDRNLIPVGDLLVLNIAQTQGIETLRQTADKIESYTGFQTYSDIFASEKEAAND